jgi:uncharacterized membrane protein YqiK
MNFLLDSLIALVSSIGGFSLWFEVLFWIGVAVLLGWLTGAIRYIRNSRVGVVEKLWSTSGSVEAGLIALAGEAGYQPGVLRGGLHFMVPFQYRVHSVQLVTIPQGQIGYVFARDGATLPPTQTLARAPRSIDFADAAHFLANGGQRGPQRAILREGTYAINLAQFVVLTLDRVFALPLEKAEEAVLTRMVKLIGERGGFTPIVIDTADDLIGIVTVHDGPSLAPGEVIAPTVGTDPASSETYHNNFQDAERFLAAGGRRGRQLQVLVEGTYYVNRLFATVELIPKTIVEVGTVGVVVSYTGETGADISGSEYGHGELVASNKRGVWSTPLLPGKYAFNTYAGRVLMVPTTNFILKWTRGQTGAHKFDENLAEVDLITKDAFEPSLPLSVVVHIDYRKAPLVVQRFGDIKRLVEQTLDPMVSAYFKNVAQTRTLIHLLQDRSAIQTQSGLEMREKFARYNLELQEVLIGTPTAGDKAGDKTSGIESILQQLRSRQIAEEQVETYSRQQTASIKERELREAEARAKQQTALTESDISIAVQSNQGKADLARAEQQAAQIQALARAESEKVRMLGEGEARKIAALASAEAERAARVGIAQAMAIEEQVRAYGGPRFQLTQQVMARFAEAIEEARVDVVPKVVIGASGSNGKEPGLGGSSILEGLLALLLSDRVGVDVSATSSAPSPEAQRMRDDLRAKLSS